VFLVVALELQREREYRLFQQAGLGADLVGRDRLEFGSERAIENGSRLGLSGYLEGALLDFEERAREARHQPVKTRLIQGA